MRFPGSSVRSNASCIAGPTMPVSCSSVPREGIARLIDATGRVSPLASPSGTAAGVVLGHRRLAIIDPSPAGHQPMATPDGRFVLALNGEIYNYRELRLELETLGVVFPVAFGHRGCCSMPGPRGARPVCRD
jgi:asparagine synthase (glutamine-hydrolysing)